MSLFSGISPGMIKIWKVFDTLIVWVNFCMYQPLQLLTRENSASLPVPTPGILGKCRKIVSF